MTITLIAAMDEKGAIGFRNGLPWPKVPEDMDRFRETTFGVPVIMGRKTFESIGRPLPKRENIVLTRDTSWSHPDVTVFSDLVEALKEYDSIGCFVIGGSEIYNQSLSYAHRLMLTHITGRYKADAFWTPDVSGWNLTRCVPVFREGKHVCSFIDYERGAPEKSLG